MVRFATAGALLVALGTAPLQCRRDPEAQTAHEESPGDALYALALTFREKGDEPAARETLRQLVLRFPSNRHAPAARAELALDARPDAAR